MEVLLIWIIIWGLCTWAGYALAGTRGAVLGFLLGILGVIIAAIIGKKQEVQPVIVNNYTTTEPVNSTTNDKA